MKRHNEDIFTNFSDLKVYCVFSLESPHRGDSIEYTQRTIINIKKKAIPNYSKYNNVCSYGIFLLGTQERVRKSSKQPWYSSHRCLRQRNSIVIVNTATMLRQRKLIIQKTDKVKKDIKTKQINGSISHKQYSLKSLRNGLWMDE